MAYHLKFSQFHPNDITADGYYQLGLELMTMTSPLYRKVAVQAFSRAIELDKCYALAYYQRAMLRYQRVKHKLTSGFTMGLRKKLLKIIEDLTKYLCLDENAGEAYLLRAKSYLHLLRYDKYAAMAFLDDYQFSLLLHVDVSELKPHLARVGLQSSRYTGDYTSALHYLDLAYEGNYDHNYFIRRSVIFDEMGKSEEAAADILRANSASVLISAYEKITLFSEAETMLLKQIELYPTNIWAKIRLAQFYDRIGSTEDAIATYQYIVRQLASTHRYYSVIQTEIERLSSTLS